LEVYAFPEFGQSKKEGERIVMWVWERARGIAARGFCFWKWVKLDGDVMVDAINIVIKICKKIVKDPQDLISSLQFFESGKGWEMAARAVFQGTMGVVSRLSDW